MKYSGNEIVSRIRSHIEKRGGDFAAWFVGVGRTAKKRLKGHGVQRKGDCWVYIHAAGPDVALKAKSDLVRTLGAGSLHDVGEAGGDFVYAYRKSARTTP